MMDHEAKGSAGQVLADTCRIRTSFLLLLFRQQRQSISCEEDCMDP